ncbi:hypothetical protein PG987_013117 [Apiospora arundinis]
MQVFAPTFFLLSLLVAWCQAMPTNEPTSLRIPSGQPEGTYVAHNWGKPNERHERLPDVPQGVRQDYASHHDDISSNGDSPSAIFTRVDSNYIACGCVNLNHNDCDNATHDLEAQFPTNRGRLVSPGDCVYSIKDSVVAFACVDARDILQGVTHGQLTCTWKAITEVCGQYKAGTRGSRGHYATGYMTSDHSNLNRDAWGSWRTSC